MDDDDGRLFADRLRAVIPSDAGRPTPVPELERLARGRQGRRRMVALAAVATSVALLSGGVYVAVGAKSASDQAATGPTSTVSPRGNFGLGGTLPPNGCPQRVQWLRQTPGAPNLARAHIVAVEACTYRYHQGAFERTSRHVTEEGRLVERLYGETRASDRGNFNLSCVEIPANAKPARTARVLVLSDRTGNTYPFFYSPFCVIPAWPDPPAHAMFPASGLLASISRLH
jgi:hypothetical protein